MNVYRIHIRPKGGKGNVKNSFSYCLDENVLGLGWQIDNPKENLSWEDYESEAKKKHGNISRVKYIKNRLRKDDLIWTRDQNGEYYLAKVKSPWEYYSNARAIDSDITNIVRCEILKVPSIDDVPGKVIACFRPSRAIQAIKNSTSVNYSKYLWNKISETTAYDLTEMEVGNIFSFIDSEETEDVIFIYLQMNGWVVIPSSRKADTMKYEFYLTNKTTKEKAIVQVKTGHTQLNPNSKEWTSRSEKVFLFQSNGKYSGSGIKNVVCLEPKVIEKFMKDNYDLMPSSIQHWIDTATKEI